MLHQAPHLWNARGAPDQYDLVDLFGLQARVFERLLAGADRAVNDRLDRLLETIERNFALIFFSARQIDIELHRGLGGKRNLGLDHGLADARYRFAVRPHVESEVAANVVERDCDQQIVDIVSAEMRVAVSGNHFENAVLKLENRDIERAAAQIVNDDDAVLVLVQTVGERCGGRFVHQSQNIQSGDAAGVFRGLPLRVIEVCGDGDDRLGYWRPEKALGIALQLAQDEGGDFRRCKSSFAQLDADHFP